MRLLFLTITMALSLNAFAGPQFTCKTEAEEGYYVKTTVKLDLKNSTSVFVKPYDAQAEEWNTGSEGSIASKKQDGTTVFKGFNSTDLFGELSEGAANEGIYIYISAEVMSGHSGLISLVARGSEVGVEKATYSCNRD